MSLGWQRWFNYLTINPRLVTVVWLESLTLLFENVSCWSFHWNRLSVLHVYFMSHPNLVWIEPLVLKSFIQRECQPGQNEDDCIKGAQHHSPLSTESTQIQPRVSSTIDAGELYTRGVPTRLGWWCQHIPDSKVHEAYMGPTWGQQGPGGPHVGPMNLAIRDMAFSITVHCQLKVQEHVGDG